MGIEREAVIRQAVAFTRKGTGEFLIPPVFTTVIIKGEGIIIDGSFVLGYKKKRDDDNPEKRTPEFKRRIVVIKGNEGTLQTGSDMKSLTTHTLRDSEIPGLKLIYFKPNESHAIIIVGEREMHISEMLNPGGTALKIDSPLPFSFERMGRRVSLPNMRERLAQRLDKR